MLFLLTTFPAAAIPNTLTPTFGPDRMLAGVEALVMVVT